MSNRKTLEELIHRATIFPGPSLRLAGLETTLGAVEDQLIHLRAQLEVRLKAKLKREACSMHPDDIEFEKYEFSQTVDELFPKVFRGGFVIALWSVFEACIKDMAEYTRRERGIPFGLQDLRAGDFLGQTEKFFFGAVGLHAFPDKQVRKEIEELRGFRNALVHHDGSTDQLPKSLRAKNPDQYRSLGLQVCSDLHHEYAVPTAEYANRNLLIVRDYLESLAKQLYANLHPGGDEGKDTGTGQPDAR